MLTDAQCAELDRRIAEDDANPEDTVPWEVVKAKGREVIEEVRRKRTVIESRRKRLANLQKQYPGATFIDVTSKGDEPWVRFSPFYPHGGIPIPNSTNEFAQSVEGLWQGLKVFEKADIDPSKWSITDMSGIKRGGRSRGAVRGHRFGIGSDVLLNYREARFRIYLPAYNWVLKQRLVKQVEELRDIYENSRLVLLDYETNSDVEDLTKPLSHAALIKLHLEGRWPSERAEKPPETRDPKGWQSRA